MGPLVHWANPALHRPQDLPVTTLEKIQRRLPLPTEKTHWDATAKSHIALKSIANAFMRLSIVVHSIVDVQTAKTYEGTKRENIWLQNDALRPKLLLPLQLLHISILGWPIV
jgi:hypothetical protein